MNHTCRSAHSYLGLLLAVAMLAATAITLGALAVNAEKSDTALNASQNPTPTPTASATPLASPTPTPVNWSTDPMLRRFVFRAIGPASMGGRIDDIACVESNSYICYIGFATG